jgi:hypothetical protein
MMSPDWLVRFGVVRRGCAREHFAGALTGHETREQFEGCNPIVPLCADVSALIGQMGSPARDRRPIIA